jgi:hypothetical protein
MRGGKASALQTEGEHTMAHEEHFHGGAAASQDGISRRKVIVTGAAIAAAGVAAGAGGALLVSNSDSKTGGVAQPGEPVMVHLQNAETGQLDLFVGERRLSFNDRALAARLAQVSNDAV